MPPCTLSLQSIRSQFNGTCVAAATTNRLLLHTQTSFSGPLCPALVVSRAVHPIVLIFAVLRFAVFHFFCSVYMESIDFSTHAVIIIAVYYKLVQLFIVIIDKFIKNYASIEKSKYYYLKFDKKSVLFLLQPGECPALHEKEK